MFDEKNLFENETAINDGALEAKEEKRPNLEALEKKRDEYIMGAIRKVEEKDPENFKREGVQDLAMDVLNILAREHGINPDVLLSGSKNFQERRQESDVLEFFDTYPEEKIIELLEEYISKK